MYGKYKKRLHVNHLWEFKGQENIAIGTVSHGNRLCAGHKFISKQKLEKSTTQFSAQVIHWTPLNHSRESERVILTDFNLF